MEEASEEAEVDNVEAGLYGGAGDDADDDGDGGEHDIIILSVSLLSNCVSFALLLLHKKRLVKLDD